MAHSYAPELAYMQPAPGNRLQGRRLLIARVTWAILVIVTLGLSAAMLPAYFIQLQAACSSQVCAIGQPSLESMRALQAYGLTVENYALVALVLTVFEMVASIVIATVIIWHRSDDWMALLVALGLVMLSTTIVTYVLEFSHSAWQMPAFIMDVLSWSAVFLLSSLFPDGRFVPRWVGWLVIVWLGYNLATIIFPFLFSLALLSNLLWLCLCACYVGAQVYRYNRVSGPLQRQQTKWIVYGTSLPTTLIIAIEIPILLFPSFGPDSLYHLVSWYGFILALTPYPVSVGFAMMRSSLWDIDIVIKRTLVYALLTALLVLVYFGIVLLLQYVFRALTGQGSPFAIVVSTLAIAVLFHPLRRSIQTFIDTRFFRRKYDVSQVLAAFDATMRARPYPSAQENLEALTNYVQEIVGETLQPQRIALWLYDPELPKESGEEVQRPQRALNGSSAQMWEEQDGSLQEIHLRVSEELLSGHEQGGEAYRQGIPLSRGYQRLIARVVWLALAALALWLYIAAIPSHAQHLHVLCADIMCGGSPSVAEVAQQLHEIGLTRDFFSTYTIVLESVFVLVYFIIAALIFWRKSDDLMALLLAAFLITFALAFTDIPHVLRQANPWLQWLSATMGLAGVISLPLFFYLFPNGRFVPRWTRWLLSGWFLWGIIEYFFPDASFQSSTWFLVLEGIAFAAGLGSIVISQVYRYRFVSSRIQRQQTKWVVFGIGLALGGFFCAGFVGFVLPGILLPVLSQNGSTLPMILGILAGSFTYLIMLLIPLSLVSAILRYRLWDIDVLINRALIYGTLAGILGLISLGILIAQEQLAEMLPVQVSELFVVVSILVIVMCFQVLLRHIQSFIDRHFYWRKYQAEQRLERFTATLRQEANLTQLSEGLLEAVSEAMEPADVSLWINKPEPTGEAPRYTGVLRL